jgi:hypothetical protein
VQGRVGREVDADDRRQVGPERGELLEDAPAPAVVLVVRLVVLVRRLVVAVVVLVDLGELDQGAQPPSTVSPAA